VIHVTASPPTTVLWVALGGAIGSSLRYVAGELLRRVPALAQFPWATLAVNVIATRERIARRVFIDFSINFFLRLLRP
jgi:hypothetical protein